MIVTVWAARPDSSNTALNPTATCRSGLSMVSIVLVCSLLRTSVKELSSLSTIMHNLLTVQMSVWRMWRSVLVGWRKRWNPALHYTCKHTQMRPQTHTSRNQQMLVPIHTPAANRNCLLVASGAVYA